MTAPAPADREVHALIEAAAQGDRRRVEELLGQGVAASATATGLGSAGRRSALSAAAEGGHEDVVERLLAAGARADDGVCIEAVASLPRALEPNERACLQRLCASGAPVWSLRDGLGKRLLVEDPESVAVLLDAGAPPDPPAAWGGSGGALFACLWEGRSLEVLRLLLEAGADPRRTDRAGRTPFSLAVRTGQTRAAAELHTLGHSISHDAILDALLRAASAGDEVGVRVRRRKQVDPADRLALEDHWMLQRALRLGRSASLASLLLAGLDPNAQDESGATALHAAIEVGSFSSVQLLLEAGARLDLRDHDDRTPVALALQTDRLPLARRLLEAGESLQRRTPLGEVRGYPFGDATLDERLRTSGAQPIRPGREERFEAARDALLDGETGRLLALLEEDPALTRARSPRPHRATLLHYLAANGVDDQQQRTPPNALKFVKLLLARGALVDATCNTYGGGTAQTTLCLAASSDVPQRAGVQGPLVRALLAGGAAVDGLRGDGEPLATAIAFRMADAVAALVAGGARLDSPLFAAAAGDATRLLQSIDAEGHVLPDAARCMVPWLLQSDDPRRAGGQALVVACSFGHDELVRLLLERGVDPSAPLGNGNAGLHEAAYSGHLAVVERLLDAGASAHDRDGQWNSTPLVWARAGGQDEVAALLLARVGADLVDCADLGLVDVAETLLSRGASPEGPDDDGAPLALAASGGHADLAALLLRHGARADRRDRRGQTPADRARRAGHAELAETLST